jgi:hypothetical protein
MNTPKDLPLPLDSAIMTKRTRHNILSWIGLILGILFLLVFSLSLPRNLALLPTHQAYASGGLSNGLFSLAFFVLWIRSERKVDAIDTKSSKLSSRNSNGRRATA